MVLLPVEEAPPKPSTAAVIGQGNGQEGVGLEITHQSVVISQALLELLEKGTHPRRVIFLLLMDAIEINHKAAHLLAALMAGIGLQQLSWLGDALQPALPKGVLADDRIDPRERDQDQEEQANANPHLAQDAEADQITQQRLHAADAHQGNHHRQDQHHHQPAPIGTVAMHLALDVGSRGAHGSSPELRGEAVVAAAPAGAEQQGNQH